MDMTPTGGRMATYIRRREFIVTLGSAAAAWPLLARAQQPERMRRVGVLMPNAADDPEYQARMTALLMTYSGRLRSCAFLRAAGFTQIGNYEPARLWLGQCRCLFSEPKKSRL